MSDRRAPGGLSHYPLPAPHVLTLLCDTAVPSRAMIKPRNTPALHPSRRGLTSSAGLRLALVAGAISIGIIAVTAWRYNTNKAAKPSGRAAPTQVVPDIKAPPQVQGNNALKNLGSSDRPFLQIADRRDPTRLAGQLEAEKSTPLEGKRYRMEKPRVWIFMRDGRTMHITADSGQALIPDMSAGRPEDGAIEGHVIAKMFAALPGGALPDPVSAEPILTLATELVKFDLRLGEVRFPDLITVVSPRVDFAGRDVLILLNEATQALSFTTRTTIDAVVAEQTGGRAERA